MRKPKPHSRPHSSTLFDSTTDQEFLFLGADQKKGMQLLDWEEECLNLVKKAIGCFKIQFQAINSRQIF